MTTVPAGLVDWRGLAWRLIADLARRDRVSEQTVCQRYGVPLDISHRYTCPVCGRHPGSPDGLAEHIARHHPAES